MDSNEEDGRIMPFGEYVRSIRLKKGLSQTGAAKLLGMAPQKLSNIESGIRHTKRVSLALISMFSEGYKIPIGELIKNTVVSVNNTRSTSDLINELIPTARMAEMLGSRLVKLLSTYPPELEEAAKELCSQVENIKALLDVLQKKHFSIRDTSHDD